MKYDDAISLLLSNPKARITIFPPDYPHPALAVIKTSLASESIDVEIYDAIRIKKDVMMRKYPSLDSIGVPCHGTLISQTI